MAMVSPRKEIAMSAGYLEEDYQPTVAPPASTRLLADTQIELVRPLPRRRPPRHVLFDFDGTLSLVREGWPEVMVPMMVEVLQATGTRRVGRTSCGGACASTS
jgi:hypothetical protein